MHGVIEDYDENEISWLTQIPKCNRGGPNFLLDYQNDENNLCSVSDSGDLVSLEEDEVKSMQKVLYDNVIVKDILSDEELDSM